MDEATVRPRAPEPKPVRRARPAGPSGRPPRATRAPSGLGSLVASLGVLELQKLLAGEAEHALVARELYLDARHHRHYLTRLLRNPDCRFDHRTWKPTEVSTLTLGEALELGGGAPSSGELGIEGDPFVGEPTCLGCGRQHGTWKPRQRLAPEDRVCAACGNPLVSSGFDLVERLSAKRVPPELLSRPLGDFGLRPGDVFSIRNGHREAHYQLALESPARPAAGQTVLLAGCGNIGSHVVPHLARMPGVGRVVLVDPDRYEPGNLASQDIGAGEFGREKVGVQAQRLRRIRPGLEVAAIAARLETLPLAHFRDAVLLGALDSRLARQQLNQVAWRAGSPWIDMAVDGPQLLCRVSVYRPGVQSPCLECGWDAEDYRSLRQVLPCEES